MMKKRQAEKIAQDGITWQTYKDVLEEAMASCEAWNCVSTINPSLTKGTAFNIFLGPIKEKAGDQLNAQVPYLVAKNMLREFGEYKFEEEPQTKRAVNSAEAHHQEPEDYAF